MSEHSRKYEFRFNNQLSYLKHHYPIFQHFEEVDEHSFSDAQKKRVLDAMNFLRRGKLIPWPLMTEIKRVFSVSEMYLLSVKREDQANQDWSSPEDDLPNFNKAESDIAAKRRFLRAWETDAIVAMNKKLPTVTA